jgi:hypothetical protein
MPALPVGDDRIGRFHLTCCSYHQHAGKGVRPMVKFVLLVMAVFVVLTVVRILRGTRRP